MSDKKTVLITGISGFTGVYLSQELKVHGWDVWGVGRHAPSAASKQYYQADLLDSDSLKRIIRDINPSAVIHLAAIAFVGHKDTKAFYENNVVASVGLLEAISSEANHIEKVLLASSANVYGNSGKPVLEESDPFNPANDYAASKASMEMVAKAWSSRLPITVARPFNYTGLGQAEDFLVPKIISHFKRKAPLIELGNLDVSRDYSDVRDIAHIYHRLLEAGSVCETYNVCSGKLASLKDIVSMASELSGHNIDIKVNPEFVRKNEIKKLCGNPSKLDRTIGDFPRKTIRETLSWMIDESVD